jgi:predicted DNA-binding ribbon-helix-helix protein
MIRRRVLPYQESKQSVVVGQRKTSLRLEVGFWDGLKEVAAHEGVPVSTLVTCIDTDREHANLSSAVRLYVLDHYRRLVEQALGAKGKR